MQLFKNFTSCSLERPLMAARGSNFFDLDEGVLTNERLALHSRCLYARSGRKPRRLRSSTHGGNPRVRQFQTPRESHEKHDWN